MVNFDIVNDLATEDAAEALNELDDDDFVNVVSELINRRTRYSTHIITANHKELIIKDIISKIY